VVAREAEVVDLKLTLQPVQESQSKTSSETFGIDMVKMDTMDLKHRHVYEVIKDGVNTEPEWCNFPGRDEFERVLPKKYWPLITNLCAIG
jgi:hypothetical protein